MKYRGVYENARGILFLLEIVTSLLRMIKWKVNRGYFSPFP